MSDIQRLTTGNRPVNSLEPIELSSPGIPEWLNTNHPDFPKFFYLAWLNEEGEAVMWWQRLPEHLNGNTFI